MKDVLIKFKDKVIYYLSGRPIVNLGLIAFIILVTSLTKNVVLFCFFMFIVFLWNVVEDQYEVYEDKDGKRQ